MKTVSFFLLLLFLSVCLSGCGKLLYLSQLGWHQSFISFHSVPVEQVLENEGVDPHVKEKIRFIQEVKRFGEEKLGLHRTRSYSKYFEIKGPVLYVLTASEKDCLQFHYWSFPIIGKVTYKSYFTEGGVSKEKRSLEKKGYDTLVQQARAYSTLGWLKDPIFSSMLPWDEPTLASLILHEMTHTTVYFKGQTDLNEQIATFVGNQGAVDFLCQKYGKESKEVMEAIESQKDDLLFSEWIDEAYQQLSQYYGRAISKDEKLNGREELFRRLKEDFKKRAGSFRTGDYKNFEKIPINNAVILAFHRYFHHLERFQALYEHLGRNTRRVVEYFKNLRVSGDSGALLSTVENPESRSQESK